MSALSILFLASCSTWLSRAQIEFKKVAEANITLPCHHRLYRLGQTSLDIEWLLKNSDAEPKVVINYAGSNTYTYFNDEQKGRVSFASNNRTGDASLEISFLQPSDAGQYTCKVKNAGQYEWTHITLKVLEKPSKPKCWKEGEMIEGKEISLQCNTVSGTTPIMYRWERIEEDGKAGSLPPMAHINFSNPAQVLLKNLTWMATGLYQCTASNEVGQESCVVKVTVQYAQNFGIVAGAVCGAMGGPALVLLAVWLTIKKKEKKKYEEEETPNEIKEDAEAPKARLVKPGSSSSGSRSSHSGSSSTRSTANSASRSQQTLSTEATPHITPTQQNQVEIDGRETEPKKINHTNFMKTEATPTMMPAQSRVFQSV
ncbi:CXADR-like membrane protein [Podarcis raffonei]|uniref:CXADR-like membrane protein n=1 Tax=Podarcis raffonei TaxID=65483 RepID=UPI002329698C|nr:CXADR-like membrane protein [Podarcis raffonei]